MECEGEDEFVVGEKYVVDGKRFKLSHIKLRDGPLMRKEGWKTIAHKIKRIYGVRSIGSFFCIFATRSHSVNEDRVP